MSGLPTWLFVSYGGGHVQALLPVARRVRDLGIARPVYLALTTAAAVVQQAGIETIGFRDLLGPGDARALTNGDELVAQLAVQATDRDESVAYLGLSYADLEQRLGVERAAADYAKFGRQSFLPLGVLDRVLDHVQPALVVATNSPRAERAAIEVAVRRGVPSVCLLDLLGIYERDLLARPDYADALCVLNDGVRDSFIAAGRPAAQVHVTGNPAFDSVRDPAVIAQGERLRHDAGWDDRHVILYASSPEPQEYPGIPGTGDPSLPRRIEAALVDAVRADERLALWVRRHPSEAPAQEIATLAHPRIRVSGRDMPLHACIHASDEVVVVGSTVGVEAQIAGKRVTQVRGSMLDHLSPYAAMGIAQREIRVEAIARAFDALPPAHARLAEAQNTQSAAERVLAVLRATAEARRG